MADSIRQQIMDAVGVRLATILTSGGYETNMGSNVFEWRADELTEAELPGVIYRDPRSEIADEQYSKHTYRLTLEMDVVAVGGTSPATLRNMIGDVIKAIGTDTTWGGLVIDTNPVSDEVQVDQADKKIMGARVTCQILYRTPTWDPY